MKDEHGEPKPISPKEIEAIRKEWSSELAMIDKTERLAYSTREDVLRMPNKLSDIINVLGLDHTSRERENMIELATAIFGKKK